MIRRWRGLLVGRIRRGGFGGLLGVAQGEVQRSWCLIVVILLRLLVLDLMFSRIYNSCTLLSFRWCYYLGWRCLFVNGQIYGTFYALSLINSLLSL